MRDSGPSVLSEPAHVSTLRLARTTVPDPRKEIGVRHGARGWHSAGAVRHTARLGEVVSSTEGTVHHSPSQTPAKGHPRKRAFLGRTVWGLRHQLHSACCLLAFPCDQPQSCAGDPCCRGRGGCGVCSSFFKLLVSVAGGGPGLPADRTLCGVPRLGNWFQGLGGTALPSLREDSAKHGSDPLEVWIEGLQ